MVFISKFTKIRWDWSRQNKIHCSGEKNVYHFAIILTWGNTVVEHIASFPPSLILRHRLQHESSIPFLMEWKWCRYRGDRIRKHLNGSLATWFQWFLYQSSGKFDLVSFKPSVGWQNELIVVCNPLKKQIIILVLAYKHIVCLCLCFNKNKLSV